MFKKSFFSILLLISLIFNTGFIVVGHRGDPLKAPEETFASIDAAFSDGAQWVELDVHESSDNQLIISHDRNLQRVTGANLIVSQHPASQLTQLKQSNGQNIYTIEQLFSHYQNNPNVKFLIETKKTKHNNPQNMEQLLVNAINKYHMQSRIMVHSFSIDSLKNMQQLAPQIPRIFIAGSLGRLNFDVFTHTNAVNVSSALLTPELISQLHAIGQQVFVWDEMTENPKQWNWLVNLPIDGVVTNFPARASYYQQLKRQANQSNVSFDATLISQNPQIIWENPYPQSPQKGMLQPNDTVHVQKIVRWNNDNYLQIDNNRFITANGLVQSDFVANLAPFLNQTVIPENNKVNRNLYLQPATKAAQKGSLNCNQAYQITALQNIDGHNWAQINNQGWIKLKNLLVLAANPDLNPQLTTTDPLINNLNHPIDINTQQALRSNANRPPSAHQVSNLPAITYTDLVANNLTALKNNIWW